ncbi:hypothetical protein PSTEL_09690 [Paenibacillus stellifer]|uniref:Phage tail tape measure protein domain-containing protein n=1 Tax=Paenibacillus stellifer TaxID=169760 RepID=A0A089LR00_9BACL|nr:phage tail tape measure protein [Paenibacillus stellifer]AIQ63317.1 hypothetical protein PSTEL_09690 [Paenibacillus stellifer]
MAGGIVGSLMYAVGFKFNSKGLDKADSKVKALTKGVIGMGAALGVMAIGIGAAALNSAGKFETAMNQMQNATGMTTAQLEETKGIAKELYSGGWGESWDDLGQSIASVKQITGMTGGALEGATRNALSLKNAFGYEVPESIRTVDTMMKNFGVTSDQAFNLIAQGKQNGLDFSGEMLDSINEYSNQFVSLGFNANQMFDTLAAGSASGAFNLDKVGDAVKEFNLRARDMTNKTTIQGFQMLGLDAKKMIKTFANGGPEAQKAFTQVVQSIAKVGDVTKQNTVATSLFGTQFEDLQAGVITAMGTARSQFDMTKNSMDSLNATKFTSIGQVFGYIGRQIEVGILIPIGQKLMPYLNQFGQWITSHQGEISAFGGLIADKIGTGIDYVVQGVKIALPYIQQFGGQFADYMQTLWPQIKDVAVQIYDVASAIVQWAPFLPLVSGITAAVLTYKAIMFGAALATNAVTLAQKIAGAATKGFAAAQAALNFVMSMNPITLIVMALVGLGVAFFVAYKRSDKFRAFIDKMWSGIKSATMAVLNFFKVTIPKYFMIAFNAVTNFLKNWGLVILGVIGGPIFLAAALIYKYWDQIKAVTIRVFTAIGSWLGSVWSSIKSTVSGVAVAIWGAVSGAWNNVVSTTSNLMTQVWNKITSIWNSIVNSVKAAGSNVWNAVSDMWNRVTGFFSGINLFDIGANIINGLVNGISSKVDAVVSKVSEIGNAITGKVKSILGIHSPSRVMMEMGFFTGEGLARGIENTAPRVGMATGSVASAAVDSAGDVARSSYTPETSPARASSGGSGPITVSPSISITVEGNADSSTVSNLKSTIHNEVLEIIMSALRSAGLDGA